MPIVITVVSFIGAFIVINTSYAVARVVVVTGASEGSNVV